jgi:undecaprenyl-diphosphatase
VRNGTCLAPATMSKSRTAVRRGFLARLAERLVRAAARHVGDARAVLALVLAAGMLIITAGALTFSWLAEEVVDGETKAFDHAILTYMGSHGSPELTDAALNMTALGSGMVVVLASVVSAAFLWASRHRWSAGLLLASVLGSGLINMTLKSFFQRPRPDVFPWRAPYAGLSSFPSGHSMTAMVAYSTLAYLVVRLERRHVLRVMTTLVAVLLIAAVGTSRVYLGVHYPSDVLAGFTAGVVWAAFCAVTMEALRLLRRREPEIAQQEKGVETGAAPPPERRQDARRAEA